MAERCERCGQRLSPEVAAALHRLRTEQPLEGGPSPDLTGLGVQVYLLLEAVGNQASSESVFTEAFARWTGIAPATFAEAVHHLAADLPHWDDDS